MPSVQDPGASGGAVCSESTSAASRQAVAGPSKGRELEELSEVQVCALCHVPETLMRLHNSPRLVASPFISLCVQNSQITL